MNETHNFKLNFKSIGSFFIKKKIFFFVIGYSFCIARFLSEAIFIKIQILI